MAKKVEKEQLGDMFNDSHFTSKIMDTITQLSEGKDGDNVQILSHLICTDRETKNKDESLENSEKEVVISRDELIELCENAVVSMESWGDRDSGAAQLQLNTIYGLLKAVAEYTAKIEGNTIWVEFPDLDRAIVDESYKYNLPIDTVEEFWEKHAHEDMEMFQGYDDREYLEYDKAPHLRMVTGYLPTWDRIHSSNGCDWI